ncbi:MAG: energy-coupled thiamine transporter ThiT, partial [Oscillospiraceae bacterium]
MPHCDRRNAAFFHRTIGVDLFESRRKTMTQTKTRALTEGALMVAAATALSYVKLLELPQGGSVCIGMLPIFLY